MATVFACFRLMMDSCILQKHHRYHASIKWIFAHVPLVMRMYRNYLMLSVRIHCFFFRPRCGSDVNREFRQGDLTSMLYWKTNARLLDKFHKVSLPLINNKRLESRLNPDRKELVEYMTATAPQKYHKWIIPKFSTCLPCHGTARSVVLTVTISSRMPTPGIRRVVPPVVAPSQCRHELGWRRQDRRERHPNENRGNHTSGRHHFGYGLQGGARFFFLFSFPSSVWSAHGGA